MGGHFRLFSAPLHIIISTAAAALSDQQADIPYDYHDAPNRFRRGDEAPSGANGSSASLSMPTWTVPATGTGTSYAQACDKEQAAYDTLLSYGITPTGTDYVYGSTWSKYTSYTAETTRLCDGRVRAIGSLTPVHVGSTLIENWPTITYSGPAPPCSVQASDCSWLRRSYLSADSSYSSSLSRYPDAPPGDSPIVPRCYVSGQPLPVCGQCTIHGGSVELLYFPDTTKTSRDMCATTPTSPVVCPFGSTSANNDTVHGFNTAPCQYIDTGHPSTTDSGPSLVVNGTTFYSNRAYISYDTLYATNSCGRVGGTYSNGLVTVASSDVYSVSGYHFQMTHAAYSFNFADLDSPVPASAYLCQAMCDSSGSPLNDGDEINGVPGGGLGFCSTIIDKEFKPRLAVPPQMRALDPQWKDCLLGLDALYDPPRLMTSDTALDMPSATGEPSAEPQQGASTGHAFASPTAAPETLDGLGDNDDSPGQHSQTSAATPEASDSGLAASSSDTSALLTAAPQTPGDPGQNMGSSGEHLETPGGTLDVPAPDPESLNTYTAVMETQSPRLTTPIDSVTTTQVSESGTADKNVQSGASSGAQQGSDVPSATQASLAVSGLHFSSGTCLLMLSCFVSGYLIW